MIAKVRGRPKSLRENCREKAAFVVLNDSYLSDLVVYFCVVVNLHVLFKVIKSVS